MRRSTLGHVFIARLAQFLLGPEVVPEQPGRHPGGPGDAPDGGTLVPLFGEVARGLLRGSGPGR